MFRFASGGPSAALVRLRSGVARGLAALAVAVSVAAAMSTPSAFAADPSPARAAATGAEHAGEAHAKAGLPQLNTDTYPTQLFWLAISFGLLLVLMSKVALPRVGEVLEARQEKIANDLDRAAALKTEVDAVVAAYEKAVADARAGAQKVLAVAAAESEAEAVRRNSALSADLAVRTREAETRILAQKQQAVQNIRMVAVEAARDAAIRLGGIDPDVSVAEAAVEAAMKERA